MPATDSSQLPAIFIIMWDALGYGEVVTDGRLDRGLVPNFAALVDDSVWFPNAQSLDANTDMSIPTFLTGVLPDSDGSFPAPLLFERMAPYYEIHVYEEKAVLARPFGCVNPAMGCRGDLYSRSQYPLNAGKWAISQYLDLIVPAKVFKSIGYFPGTYEP